MFFQDRFSSYLLQITGIRHEIDTTPATILTLFQFQIDRSTAHRRNIPVKQTLTRCYIVLPDPQAGDLAFLHFRQWSGGLRSYRVICTYCQRIRLDRAVRSKSDATGNGSPVSQHTQDKPGIHFLLSMKRNIIFFHIRLRTTSCKQQKQQCKQPCFTYSFHCISFFIVSIFVCFEPNRRTLTEYEHNEHTHFLRRWYYYYDYHC